MGEKDEAASLCGSCKSGESAHFIRRAADHPPAEAAQGRSGRKSTSASSRTSGIGPERGPERGRGEESEGLGGTAGSGGAVQKSERALRQAESRPAPLLPTLRTRPPHLLPCRLPPRPHEASETGRT